MLKKKYVVTFIVLAVLVIDQMLKVWVKTTMSLHEQIEILSWFKLVFVENNGMAYGMEIGSKLLLSLFRIVAIGFLMWYTVRQVLKNASWGYLVCLALVLAGAMGNVIDCMFYGLIFNEATPYTVSHFVDFGEGYSTFLNGKVVDMFYFPMIVTTYPDWFPVWGGDDFIFFSPVFNFADAAISCGVVAIFLFYRNELQTKKPEPAPEEQSKDDQT